MSTYAHVFIETQDDEDRWNMVKVYRPYKREMLEQKWIDGSVVPVYSEPDETTNSGQNLSQVEYFTTQGFVRDLVSTTPHESHNFANRGLPEDLSNGIATWFERETKKTEEERKERGYGKWWWGETYVTLAELYDAFDKLLEEWQHSVQSTFDSLEKLSSTNKKLDKIISILQSEKNLKDDETEIVEDENELEYIEYNKSYLLEERIYDLLNLWSFCRMVDEIAIECSDCYNNNKVRTVIFLA